MVHGHTPQEPGQAAGSPKRMGRYALLDHFATGGTAELYVALRDGTQDICLLKVLSAQLKADSRAVKRLQREAAIAFRLSHPNFAQLVSAGDEGGRFTLASEFIAGQNIAAIMAKTTELGMSVPLDLALAIVFNVLDGLEYLHNQTGDDGKLLDLVHRDLTVANVILGFNGEVKIIDLGAMHGRLDDFQTAAGVVLGTPQTMSPEQAVGGTIDRRTDVYAAGLMLYQVLTATLPFAGATLFDTLDQVRSFVPPLASEIRADVPKALAQVLAAALAKETSERPATAGLLKKSLAEAAGVKPAAKEALAQFVTKLVPEELKRMENLAARGRQQAQEQAEFESEESLQQGAFTKAGVTIPQMMDESAARTAIVRTRSTPSGGVEEFAPVIPLPRRGASHIQVVQPQRSATAPNQAHTPTVMEMPGTAVVKVSQTSLVRDTRALRSEVERWRYAFIAAVTAGMAGMIVVGVIAMRWASTPQAAPAQPPTPAASAAPGAGPISATSGVPAVPEVAPSPPPVATAEPKPTLAAAPLATAKPRPTIAVAHPTPAAARPEAEASAAPTPAPTAAPDKPKDDEIGALKRMFAQVREDPHDSKAFDALAARVRKAAQQAPDERRRLILSDVAAAERSYDPEPLGDAIKKLER